MKLTVPKTKDLATRAAWTLVQAALGFAIAEVAGLPAEYGVPIAALLSVAKSYVAQQLEERRARH